MPRSKLELYIDIIKSLFEHGPLSLQEISPIIGIETVELKPQLNMLIKHGLINEKKTRYETGPYTITEQGIKIINFFKIPTNKKPLSH
jgi:predicted transcriptional regulator